MLNYPAAAINYAEHFLHHTRIELSTAATADTTAPTAFRGRSRPKGAEDLEEAEEAEEGATHISSSDEWTNFFDVLGAQTPLTFFDEDSQQIRNLSYTDLLYFTHMSIPTIRALNRYQHSDSCTDTLPC